MMAVADEQFKQQINLSQLSFQSLQTQSSYEIE
jgi:hypothetical protein